MMALSLSDSSEYERPSQCDQEQDLEHRDDLEAEDLDGPDALATADPVRVRHLVTSYHAFVWRSLVRLGVPRADAEDATQQVFLVAARKLDLIPTTAERSFLYGTALRVASRARRTLMRRREAMDGEPPDQACPSCPQDEALDRARARALLDEILEQMPLDLRSVFTLYELEQLTMTEIADVLAVPQGTVASRLRRARELFTAGRNRLEARMKFAERSRNGEPLDSPKEDRHA